MVYPLPIFWIPYTYIVLFSIGKKTILYIISQYLNKVVTTLETRREDKSIENILL